MFESPHKTRGRIPKELVEQVAEHEAGLLLKQGVYVKNKLYYPFQYTGLNGIGLGFLAYPFDLLPDGLEDLEAPMAIPVVHLILPFEPVAALARYQEAGGLSSAETTEP